MAKYGKYSTRVDQSTRPWKIHPVWQGIGCIMLIIIPLMAYAGAVLLVEANWEAGWVPAPYDFMKAVYIPVVNIVVDHLYANLAVAFLLSLLGFGAMMIVYTVIYSVIGPSRYGPLDSPPLREKMDAPIRRRK